MKRTRFSAIVLTGIVLFAPLAIAVERNVPSEYATIQAAINASGNGDVVIVASGTYTGTGNKDLDFAGKAITVKSTNPQDPCVVAGTVIDCQSSGRGFYFHSGEGADSILSGFTIQNGNITGSPGKGGGILCENASPTITNCVIKNNYNYGANGIVDGDLNGQPAYGAGIYCQNSTANITYCTISGNLAKGGKGDNGGRFEAAGYGGYAYGGGIYCQNSTVSIINCTISSNLAQGGYGGSNNYEGAGRGGNAYGGGIYCDSTSGGNISDCTISSNIAYGGEGGMGVADPVGGFVYGGGMYGPAAVNNCLILNNQAAAPYSGGMYGYSEAYGGGIAFNPMTINNCTIANNRIEATFCYGSGIYGSSTVINSIIWGNVTWSGGPSANQIQGSAIVTYSDIQGGYSGTGNINANPLFVAGPEGNYYLSQIAAGQATNSLCIDAGSDTVENLNMNLLTTRTDTVPDAGIVDIGYHFITVNRRTLTCSSTDGGVVTTPGEGISQYDNDTNVSIVATADAHYHFVNWTGTAVDVGKVTSPTSESTTVLMDADYTVVANFAIDTFTLSYTAGINGTLTGETSQVVNYGSNGTAVTAVPNTGYHFVSWSDVSTENPRADLNVTANITVTANFAIDTFALSYTAGSGGTLTGNTSQVINYGSNGTAVTAVPDTGYHFVNWSDASTQNPRTDLNVTASITVTANFAIDTFALSYTVGSGGTLTGNTSQVVNYGSNGTAVTAVPDIGYHFVNWSDASTQNPRTDLNVTANISVTANFALTPVSILGSWVTGKTHAKESGSNRALVFVAHAKCSSGATSLNSVKYGKYSMTKVIDKIIGSAPNRVYVAAFILNEAGINAAADSTFAPDWTPKPSDVTYSSVFLENVNQTTLLGAKASNGVTGDSSVSTSPLATSNRDMVIENSTSSVTGTYSVTTGWSKDIDLGVNGYDGMDGRKSATGVSETPSVSQQIGNHALIGFVIRSIP